MNLCHGSVRPSEMRVMDCRNFKELLDSYLCGELAVETNHAILGHAEHCGACRDEMAARRALRQSLRRACSREEMSAEAIERMRARLRAEAGLADRATGAAVKTGRRGWLTRLFEARLLVPVAATAALLLLIGGAWSLYVVWPKAGPEQTVAEKNRVPELSERLIGESAGDHRNCAAKFLNATEPAEMPDSVREFDPACVRLDKVAAEGAKGLLLRSAHVCGYGERRFAHLVYTRDDRLISLLVTKRDARALKIGDVPPFDGLSAGLQQYEQVEQDRLALGAYQTAKHVVLVVSDLPESENRALAERLAKPVVEHLRSAELSRAALNPEERLGRLSPREWNRL